MTRHVGSKYKDTGEERMDRVLGVRMVCLYSSNSQADTRKAVICSVWWFCFQAAVAPPWLSSDWPHGLYENPLTL